MPVHRHFAIRNVLGLALSVWVSTNAWAAPDPYGHEHPAPAPVATPAPTEHDHHHGHPAPEPTATPAASHDHHHGHPTAAPSPGGHDHHMHPGAQDGATADPRHSEAAMRLMRQGQEIGSGTALIPQNSPMRMWWGYDADWLWMLHGDV